MFLERINNANDIKKISPKDYKNLAKEIRTFLIDKVSKTGGHLASNLGVVELTMALHLFLDFPEDKLIWDVGHQAYTHKLLTGRKEGFDTLRQFKGMSGFPKTSESDCDAFNTGHSSTSISAAEGIAKARDLLHKTNKVVAVIGDGALSGGLAYEALNNAGRLNSNMIIVLNDNNMSISENVGAMATYLGKIRTSSKYTKLKIDIEDTLNSVPVVGEKLVKSIRSSKESLKSLFIPGMIFENMGLTYIGPIDGHNIPLMLAAFNAASQNKTPVLVHVITGKGNGYIPAETNPSEFHGIGPFNPKTGKKSGNSSVTYTDIFSKKLIQLCRSNKQLVAITAAMSDGTGLNEIKKYYPNRFFDVGIAEEHAVTFAAGLASEGLHPVFAVYSTFLQRAYDQIIHDVAMSGLPVTFAIDRAGIVGNDGETHQGIFDISYMSHIPGMVVMAPKDASELEKMLEFSTEYQGPSSIRYPRGAASFALSSFNAPIELGKSEILLKGNDVTIFAVGDMVEPLFDVCNEIKNEGIDITLVNVRFTAPVDKELILEQLKSSKVIVSCEDNVKRGGFGESLACILMENGYKGKFLNITLPDDYLEQGNPAELFASVGMDRNSLKKQICNLLNK